MKIFVTVIFIIGFLLCICFYITCSLSLFIFYIFLNIFISIAWII